MLPISQFPWVRSLSVAWPSASASGSLLWSRLLPGQRSLLKAQLRGVLLPSSLGGLLAPFSSLQVVGPRASVLLWLSARDGLNSCRQGLSIGKLSTWQRALLEEAEGAREYEQDGRQSLFVT